MRPLAALALALLALGTARHAAAAGMFFYKFTPIADTQAGLPYIALFGAPAINSSGRIVFQGRLTGGVEGVFTRLGTGGVNTLADTGVGPYTSFGLTMSINSLNTVLLSGLKTNQDPVVVTLLRGEGNSATPLVSTSNALDDFCEAQINIQGTVAYRGRRPDNTHVILARGQGPLTGVVRTIATEGVDGFSQLNCTPSISFDGTVAFVGIQHGVRGIFTRSPDNTLTRVIDTSQGFAAFRDVAINQFGGVAFSGTLQGGGEALFRTSGGVLTKIADFTTLNGGFFAGFSINESGQVAYQVSHGANGSEVFRGPNSVFGRVLGIGNLLFGRVVLNVQIARDSLNSTGQLAARVQFIGGGEMIVRGDPARRFPDFDLATGGLLLTAGNGTGVSVGTPLPTPLAELLLSFDVMFVTSDGELNVKWGDTVLKSIAASEPGVRRRMSMKIDLRDLYKDRKLDPAGSLQFALAGKPGAGVQISDVVIPGLFADQMDSLSRWRVDTSGGGIATVVSTARLPVKIQLRQSARSVVSVAVLSTEDLDATADIERSTLRLAGSPARGMRDKAGKEQLACDARDVNDDKLKDLVCEMEVKGPGRPDAKQNWSLEAMTHFGWGIAGSEVLRTGSPATSISAPPSAPASIRP